MMETEWDRQVEQEQVIRVEEGTDKDPSWGIDYRFPKAENVKYYCSPTELLLQLQLAERAKAECAIHPSSSSVRITTVPKILHKLSFFQAYLFICLFIHLFQLSPYYLKREKHNPLSSQRRVSSFSLQTAYDLTLFVASYFHLTWPIWMICIFIHLFVLCFVFL